MKETFEEYLEHVLRYDCEETEVEHEFLCSIASGTTTRNEFIVRSDQHDFGSFPSLMEILRALFVRCESNIGILPYRLKENMGFFRPYLDIVDLLDEETLEFLRDYCFCRDLEESEQIVDGMIFPRSANVG